MKIQRYNPSTDSTKWDAFIERSKNGTFLFLRGYMDYHSDRFQDYSLLYYSDKGRMVAVMPANEKDGVLYSHQGLTYGGFILATEIHSIDVIELFDITKTYLHEHGFHEWNYKQMPTIYHCLPAEEDEYCLWKMKAEIECCGLSTTVLLLSNTDIASSRKRSYKNKLLFLGCRVVFDDDIRRFWPILTDNLMTAHELNPVHTLDEMLLLKSRFPKQIICCTVEDAEGNVLAGTIIYITSQVIHTQYISASAMGKKTHAMDFLMLMLIEQYRNDGKYRYFDFGISTEDHGNYLNEGLCMQKEGFGGRSVVYKSYKISL